MLKFILIAAMVLFMSCAEDSPQSPVIPNEKKEFSLELSANQSVLKLGDLPDFVLKMKNNTDSSIVLPLFLEGSADLERYPHAYYVIDGKPSTTKIKTNSDQEYPQPLSPTNFITLRSGETYYPDMSILKLSIQGQFSSEGVYYINFVYCLESDNLKDWGYSEANDKEKATMLQVFDRVPKETFTSNVIEIHVKND